MNLNLFYFSPIHRKTVFVELKTNESIEDLYKRISLKESIPENEFKLYSNGKRLETIKHLINDSVIELHFSLNGGKGGFGSMLRAIGAQIEKTTNREACRDLTGRRLRDINEEKRIKEWIKKEKKRKEEMEERKRQKLEKMTQKPKIEFNDIEFEKTRNEIPDIVDEALHYGLKIQQKGGQTAGPSGLQKRKSEEQLNQNKLKKNTNLWIEECIDIEDSEEDNEEIITSDCIEEHNTSDSVQNDSETTNVCQTIESSEEETQKSNEEKTTEDNFDEPKSSSDSTDIEKSESIATDIQQTNTSIQESMNESNKESVFQSLNLMDFENIQQLESLGLDRLKHALMALGLKCGGTLNERANRLWSIRGLNISDIPKKLFAKKK